MATLKVTLKTTKIYKDGTSPVIIKIRANGKVSEVQVCRVHPKAWMEDKGRVRATYPNASELNELIHSKKSGAEQILFQLQKDKKYINPETVLSSQVASKLIFSDYVKEYINQKLTIGDIDLRTKNNYTRHIRALLAFNKGKNVLYSDLSESWIANFLDWSKNGGLSKKGLGQNGLRRRVEFLSSVWENAMSKGLINFNPFEVIRIKKTKIRKRKLSSFEIIAIENLILEPNTTIYKVRCAFLMQYYLRGVRISDVLTLRRSNIINERIEFITMKTGSIHSVRIHPKLENLLNTCLSYNEPYIIPLLKWKSDSKKTYRENDAALKRSIKLCTDKVNYHLRIIKKMIGTDKDITSHISRHTFASQIDSIEPDKRKISAMLGHSTVTMTETYLEELRNEDLDESAESIF